MTNSIWGSFRVHKLRIFLDQKVYLTLALLLLMGFSYLGF